MMYKNNYYMRVNNRIETKNNINENKDSLAIFFWNQNLLKTLALEFHLHLQCLF